MASRRIAALAALLAAAACQEGVDLVISQPAGGAVTLDVAAQASGFRACIDTATIYPAGRPDAPAWETGRSDPGRCVRRVAVGVDAAGFAQRASAPLRPGEPYCAEVNGPGFGVRGAFVIEGGTVRRDDDEGEPAC